VCREHKKQVKVRDVELPDETAAREYILKIQRQRRNLTREAMSYFRGVEYNATKKPRGGKRPPKGQSDPSPTTPSSPAPSPTTAAQIGEQYGVSEKTVKRDGIFAQVVDKIVADYGAPEIKRKLLGADVRLTQGTARKLYRMSKQDLKAAVDQLVQQGELPRAKKGSVSARKPKEIAQSLVTRLKTKGEEHARSVLLQMAKLLGMEVVEKKPEK
jgi:hypothetical protein